MSLRVPKSDAPDRSDADAHTGFKAGKTGKDESMTNTRTNQTARVHRAALTGAAALTLVGGLGVMPGCRGDRSDSPPRQFFPDMDEQPKVKPQSESQFYSDKRGTRPVVPGTVAWGASTHDPAVIADAEWAGFVRTDRDRRLAADRTFSFGLVSGSGAETPVYAEVMPVEVSRELILEGQQKFDIYCSACHGYTGTGNGTVGVLWSYPPANLLGDLYKDRSAEKGTDGYLFHVIREGVWVEGVNRMPPYKHAVDEQEAWAIVAYLRTLQESQAVPVDALEASDRERLRAEGGNR